MPRLDNFKTLRMTANGKAHVRVTLPNARYISLVEKAAQQKGLAVGTYAFHAAVRAAAADTNMPEPDLLELLRS